MHLQEVKLANNFANKGYLGFEPITLVSQRTSSICTVECGNLLPVCIRYGGRRLSTELVAWVTHDPLAVLDAEPSQTGAFSFECDEIHMMLSVLLEKAFGTLDRPLLPFGKYLLPDWDYEAGR